MSGAEADKMPGPRERRELTTTQVAKLVSSGRNWMDDWTGEVPAKVNSYHGGAPNEIATPRLVGARNDKRGPRLINQAAIKTLRRDRQMLVSSLFLTPVKESLPAFSYRSIYPAGQGEGRMGLTSKTTISAHGAFSTGRVPVGGGR